MDELNLPGNRHAFRMITVVIGVAALYWARELLIPLALAVLVSFFALSRCRPFATTRAP
jgi:predicted PurR-regulated permease PerM